MTSTSRLTTSPTPLCPNVVRSSVVGMRETPKESSPTWATVSDTPSTVMEPFSTTYAARPGGRVKSTVSQRSPGVRAVMVAVPSTWPWTTWPPNRPSAGIARSRLTRSPGDRAPRLLRSSVSAMTSTVKPIGSCSVTVRHTPLTAMEAPCVASETTSGPSMRSTAEAGPCSMPATVPSSSTIPVNMTVSSGLCRQARVGGGGVVAAGDGVDADVLPHDGDVDETQPSGVRDGPDAEVGDRGAAGAQQRGRDVRVDVVDEPGSDERGGQGRAALEPHVADAPAPQRVQRLARVAGGQLDGAAGAVVHPRARGEVAQTHHDAEGLVGGRRAVRHTYGEPRVVDEGGAGAVRGSAAAVERRRELPRDQGAAEEDRAAPALVEVGGLVGEHSPADLDAGGVQPLGPAGRVRVGVGLGEDH